MLLIEWSMAGVMTALFMSHWVNEFGQRRALDCVLAAAGAVVGGFLAYTFGPTTGAAIAIYAFAAPALGAAVVLLIQHRWPHAQRADDAVFE